MRYDISRPQYCSVSSRESRRCLFSGEGEPAEVRDQHLKYVWVARECRIGKLCSGESRYNWPDQDNR